MSMYRVISCVVGRGCLLWPVCSLDKTVSIDPASFCTPPRPNFLYSRYLLTAYFAFQSPMIKKTFLVVFYKVLLVFIEPFNFSVFGIRGWGIDLDYCDVEWFALETNRNHSVISRLYPSTAFQTVVADYEGDSISSKGFLPTVVVIMVIWI